MSDTGRNARGAGQIVYAHHLHLDSIDLGRDCHREHDASQNYLYTVRGKPRPMLIIGPNGEKSNGIQWYWVLKLTSVGGDAAAAQRRGYVRLGRLLDDRTVSYTERRPYSIPENLFEQEVKALGPHELQAVLSIAKIRPGGPLR
ncbi:MAG: hypothetical protein ACHQ50_14685 [Fimbriimonadales bacterium]